MCTKQLMCEKRSPAKAAAQVGGEAPGVSPPTMSDVSTALKKLPQGATLAPKQARHWGVVQAL